MTRRVVLATALFSAFAMLVFAQDREEEKLALPPYVVKTQPENRAIDVGPTLREIKVTFDRKMDVNRSWSWIIHRHLGAYPGSRDLGEPRWENEGRTCVLPVRLRPNTVYAVGCNSIRHTGFRPARVDFQNGTGGMSPS